MDYPFTEKNSQFFYDASGFSFLNPLVENVEVIRKELMNLDKAERTNWFTTYPQYVTSETSDSWQVFTFKLFGIRSKENALLCPHTAQLIQDIPQIISCDFSTLKPHTHIRPHTGYTKTILRCHLPLIVPEGNLCSIRVGDVEKSWKIGELMVFDDSFEHEAWNRSDEKRVVLMFDIPNPFWGYTPDQISRYRIENLKDKFLLSLAPKEKWLEMYEQGYFMADP